MSTANSFPIDDQHLPSPYPPAIRPQEENPSAILNHPLPTDKWIDRVKTYFVTTDGRIALARILIALICVVLQHIMGTCHHSVSDGTSVVKWHIFTPPCRFNKIKSSSIRIFCS